MATPLFISEANKLKNIQLNIEKSDNLLIEHIIKHEDSNIRVLINDLHEIRNRECKTAQSEILNILEAINAIKTKISDDISDINLTSLKKEMIIIQESIQNYKHQTKNQLNILEEQEKNLFEDIKSYDQKIIDWNKPNQLNIENIIKPKYYENINENHKCQEVTDYFKYVQESGGYENGWSVEDHNMFIKLRKKHKKINLVSKILHTALPDISEEDIIAHESWYLKYLDLKNKQREAIKIWRETKSLNTITNGTKIETDEKLTEVIKVEIKKDCTIKEKLAAWKAEKMNNLKKQLEIENILTRAKKDIEKKKKQRKEEQKKEVIDWKIEKYTAIQTVKVEKELALIQEKEIKATLARKLIKQYQSQDDIFIRKIKEKRNVPRVKSVDRVSSRTSIKVPRDPKRLLQPTKQWLHRTLSTEDETVKNDPKFVCNVRVIPKLGVPAWRKDS